MDVTQVTPEAGSRSGRRRQESRAKLLAAARRVFVERGYHAARPQDIARLAGVGHGTFYLHFTDKQECFLAFVEEAHRELEEELARRMPGQQGLEDRIRALLAGLHDYAERNPGVLRAAMTDLEVIAPGQSPRESLAARWAREGSGALARGMAQGAVRADYDPLVVGHAIVGLIQGSLDGGHEQRIGRERLIDNLTRFLSRALMAPAQRVPRPQEAGT